MSPRADELHEWAELQAEWGRRQLTRRLAQESAATRARETQDDIEDES
jgi:hypothetical protein